eukprot:SAG22_NODE_582_length_8879_cov_2.731663_3_plen_127_part_00
MHVLPGNRGAVKFVTSAFWGPAAAIARVGGKGTVSFTECHFDSWDHYVNANGTAYEQRQTAAVVQDGGTLIMSGNEFKMPGTQAKLMGLKGTKTIITENIIKGEMHIENGELGGKVIVANNADDSE